ncbi:PREDICTED: uncharacterized protein LOC109151863 [Ipomoea nil]|uniref:uncharacterized protein LOC109151863 n=1 Tax=Ipomoea nil TaxID=35883 RepID=UPI000900A2DB|nr:PREDICTED: uncharacterized protein LOC109151863 [Ipomoea nil]
MEKVVNPYDKESMKMAMLKHEETFRYQVYELHRLYRIQKGLMKNIAEQKRQESQKGAKKAAITNSNSSKGTAEEECIGESGDLGIEDDESKLELTLGPSCYNNRRRKAAEAASDSALSFSSSSSDYSSHVRRSSSGKAAESNLGEIKSRSNAPPAQQFTQDQMKKTHPPWLFQFLSLNMT